MKNNLILEKQEIKDKIHLIRGAQVMFDSDLAELYHVKIKRLNEQVKRNIKRFPENFMFQLNEGEYDFLRSQFATSSSNDKILRSQIVTLKKESNLKFQEDTSKSNHGGRRYLPYVFTEQGVAMLSGVLKSDTAIRVSNNECFCYFEKIHFFKFSDVSKNRCC